MATEDARPKCLLRDADGEATPPVVRWKVNTDTREYLAKLIVEVKIAGIELYESAPSLSWVSIILDICRWWEILDIPEQDLLCDLD